MTRQLRRGAVTRIIRVDPEVLAYLEARRRPEENKAAGYSRVIREAIAMRAILAHAIVRSRRQQP